MAIRWSALSRDSVQQWSDLTNLLAEVDGTGEVYSPQDLAEELDEPGVDPALDTWAVWAGDLLVGFGQLRVSSGLSEGRVRAQLGGGVHPQHRGRGIGRELMQRLESRAMALAGDRHPGVDVMLRASGGLATDPVRALLEHRGYSVARYFTEMKRDLPGEPIPLPQRAVRLFTPELSEAVRLAHNDAFSTHWGSSPQDRGAWEADRASRTFRPDASFVSTGDGGEVTAYVLCYQWVEGELYVGQVGTRPSHRGHGLARACLLAALHAGAEQGYQSMELSVDSANPTGAGALYESVGFHATKTFATYARVEPALTLDS